MTQVKEWSNAELNRKLAELMGYTVYHREDLGLDFYRLTDPSGIAVQGFFNGQRDTEEEAWLDIPHFCSDPAASLEVQAKAIEVSAGEYVINLQKVVYTGNINETISALLNATPRERAEAAYLTMQQINEQ
jgi:hypothetical protein